MVTTVTIFGFLFYLFNELEDECNDSRWKYTRFKKYSWFLDKELSWVRKWKYVRTETIHLFPAEKKWYYFGVTPKYKEAFPYSSTLLVWLTDGGHLFQFIKLIMISLAFIPFGVKYSIAFFVGISLFSYVKEKFIKWMN